MEEDRARALLQDERERVEQLLAVAREDAASDHSGHAAPNSTSAKRQAWCRSALLGIPIEWAEEQFRALGRRDARDLAVELLAAYEGSAVLANTLRDPDILFEGGTAS